MPSKHLQELRSAIGQLRKHLLPSKFSPTGLYRERVYTGVVSFRVLSHGAIEEYFERRVAEIAKAAAKCCKDSGVVGTTAACLVSFSEVQFSSPPDTLKAPQENQKKIWPEKIDVRARVARAAAQYINFVSRDNHGIKEINLMRLLIPIGFRPEKIDEFALSELDSFGKLRGEFAHSAATDHVAKRPDPEEELKRVRSLLTLMKDIDQELDAILRNCR